MMIEPYSNISVPSFKSPVRSYCCFSKVPLFPVKKPTTVSYLESIRGPISAKELAERPDHIPHYLPAMRPEWCIPQRPARPAAEVRPVLEMSTAQDSDESTPAGTSTTSKQ
ncbi:unnamed protein product, partial [Gongylonema pulchrum]|uniref:28S ribosomal protein S36, mitochondrial n=1 Tax=Gongylonema pulchrum TaxID=637853 RepID=A0A183DA03_9BILA